MTENEQLARWLGHTTDGVNWYSPGSTSGKLLRAAPRLDGWRVPSIEDIRTSNEWAGAVLEKLAYSGVELTSRYSTILGKTTWSIEMNYFSFATPDHDNWRAAVIDAALEVIRRDSSATAGKS